jgi:hypothetical protein
LEATVGPQGGNEFNLKEVKVGSNIRGKACLISNQIEVHAELRYPSLHVGRGARSVHVWGDELKVPIRDTGQQPHCRVCEKLRVTVGGVLPVWENQDTGEG